MIIMTYNYTDRFRIAMELSFERAKELGAVEVTPDLLLYGIIKEGSAPYAEFLKSRGVDTQDILSRYDEYIEQRTPRSPNEQDPTLGERGRLAISEAVKSCDQDEPAVTPMHLFKVLVESDNDTYIKRLIVDKALGFTSPEGNEVVQSIMGAMTKLLGSMPPHNSLKEEENSDEEEEEEDDNVMNTRNSTQSTASRKQKGKGKTPMLDRFGRDLTALVKEGKLDPVIGRQREIERMAQILGRRRKSNPILIGEPGVGKTSLVEGLAQRIIDQEVPAHLIGKRVLELDLSSIVAGTKYRGQFEERLKDIIEELESSHDVIIYIDEIHTMVGAGGGSGSMDAANMLKPALARGGVQCIGATTLEEYRKHIEKDGALERRFQKIIVEPSSREESLEILRQLRPYYEEHHKVRFSDEALVAMVNLADRYLTDRSFPDKAIDLMDETGARLGSHTIEPEELNPIAGLEAERNEYVARKLEAIKEQKFELAASYRNKERELEQVIQDTHEQLKNQLQAKYVPVEAANVSEVLAMMTAIPVQNISSGELEQLKTLEPRLKAKVIGQDTALETLVRSIKRNRLGLRDSKRPIGTFLFLGPTGVGKTYLVKCLAEELFGSADALIRVDMSEYMEKFAVSRLVGAPPGYVGHEDGGQLTEQVRRKPYSIVLFDEIEKAHADVYNLLLQVLDEGYLTDSYGRRVDFRNTIIVLTSNVGSREARSFGRGIGYQSDAVALDRSADIIRKALHKTFSPEFLNRIDEVITFSPLDEKSIAQIVRIELIPLQERLQHLGYNLTWDDEAMQILVKQAYHPEYGARPLRRTLQTEVEDRLTDLILDAEIQEGDTLRLSSHDGKLILKQDKQ